MLRFTDYFRFYARFEPDRTLLIDAKGELTAAEAHQRMLQIARALAEAGVKPGDRVAVLGRNSSELALTLFAAAHIGAIGAPLNWRLAPAEIEVILKDARPAVVIVLDAEFLALAGPAAAAGGAAFFTTAPDAGKPWRDWAAHVAAQEPAQAAAAAAPDTPAAQLYTSGTTGAPKGVMLTHLNFAGLASHGIWLAAQGPRPPSGPEIELLVAPFFHIGGLGTFMNAIAMGATVILHGDFHPGVVVETIEKRRVTRTFMVPAMIQAILAMVPDLEKRDFSALNSVNYGASPISDVVLRQAIDTFDCHMAQIYGLTEVCGAATTLTWRDHQRALTEKPELLLSCGRALAHAEVKVIGPDGAELPTGETGEIAIRTPLAMAGYWEKPDLTAEAFSGEWFRTGDAGYVDDEGYIYLRDRVKDMVVTGGENVYPVEVEKALFAHPAIGDVAVIGVPDETYGEALLAVAVLKPGATLELDELVAFSRDKLAGFKIPRRLEIVDALPRNATGKVLKTVLREPYWKDRERRVG